MKVKEKIANIIAHNAEKIAFKSVGKSILIGAYEVKPPEELLKKKKDSQK